MITDHLLDQMRSNAVEWATEALGMEPGFKPAPEHIEQRRHWVFPVTVPKGIWSGTAVRNKVLGACREAQETAQRVASTHIEAWSLGRFVDISVIDPDTDSITAALNVLLAASPPHHCPCWKS
jgi:hypothetical protein